MATQEYEYQAFAFFGIKQWNSEVAKLAADGWELVNGNMAGTASYAYMRRPLERPAQQ